MKNRALRYVLLLLAVNCAAAESLSTNLDLIPENASLIPESLLWSRDIEMRLGFGYKDNALLAPSNPLGTPIFASGLDILLYRLPLDGLEFTLLVSGDDQRYLRDVGVRGTDEALLYSQAQKYLGRGIRAGLELRYAYINDVQNALTTNGPSSVPTRGHQLSARPFAREDINANWWLRLETPVTGQWLHDPLDDTLKLGPQVTLGGDWTPAQVTVSYGAFRVWHNQWQAAEADGTPLPSGTRLELLQHEAELKWEETWGVEKQWRTVAKFGFISSTDNGGGFYNYDDYRASGELRYRTKDWEIKESARVSFFDYPVQNLGGAESPKLHQILVDLTLRLQRTLYKSVKLYCEWDYSRALSNQSSSEYDANSVIGGVSLEF